MTATKLEIEEGKYYRDSRGQKRGPMAGHNFKWESGKSKANDPEWTNDGKAKKGGVDLISEWTDEPTHSPQDEGWIEWPSGEYPHPGEIVEVASRTGMTARIPSSWLRGDGLDIVRYRVVKPAEAEATESATAIDAALSAASWWRLTDGGRPGSPFKLVDIKLSNGALVERTEPFRWNWDKRGGEPYVTHFRFSQPAAEKPPSPTKDDGGPAFPSGAMAQGPDGYFRSVKANAEGMSLREYFAGQALAGLCANTSWCQQATPMSMGFDTYDPEVIAQECHRLADAMLAARKGEQP